MQNGVLLKTQNIFKSFGPTKALTDVSIAIKHGEIHGLIGENGSGKSTLSSIIAGARKLDSGFMYLEDREYGPSSVVEAASNSVSMVLQELGTIGMISVAANVFIGKENLFTHYGILNVRRMYQATSKILASIGASHIQPNVMIDSLTFEERKLVEIARAMYSNPKLFIVDETTTALTIKGREILYAIMRKLRENGQSVLFISHDINEVMQLCDSLTILKDGCITAKLGKSEFESNQIKQLMVGREIAENFYRADYEGSHQTEVTLQADNISYGILKNISFELHKGEILGVGGLTDCGMHDLGKIMFGLIKPDQGSVRTGKGAVLDSAISAIDNGVGYVSKNRDKEALMLLGSIKDNICLPSLGLLKRFGLILKKAEKKFVAQWVDALQIKVNSLDQFCLSLSGGNKQKVVLAKWLGKDSEVLILDCPTRGIDIGVKTAIYKLMTELKSKGKAILMISEELPELIGMSDRIMILKDGVLTGEYQRSKDLSEAELIKNMI
jgi:ribose transport system ATP-binding protein